MNITAYFYFIFYFISALFRH